MTAFADNNIVGEILLTQFRNLSPAPLLLSSSEEYGASVGAVVVIVFLLVVVFLLLWGRYRARVLKFERAEKMLDFATDATGVSIWCFDVDKKELSLVRGISFLSKGRIDLDAFVAMLVPEYRDQFRKLIFDITAGKQGKTSTLYRIKENKSDFYVECHLCGIQEGQVKGIRRIILTMKEVTGMIEQQKKQELEYLKTDLVITSCEIVLWDYDVLQQRVHSFREGVFRKEQPIDVDTYVESIHPDDRPMVLQCFHQMDNGTLGRFEIEVRAIVGDYTDFQWIVITGIPYKRDDSGRVIKYTGLRRNNTDWHKIREDVVVLKDKKLKANRLESAFLADINYRLRTPLNAVVGFSSLLDKAEYEQDRQLFIEAIRLNNELLLSTLADIVEYSKTEEDTIRYNNSLFSAARICREAFERNADRVFSEIKFVVTIPDSDVVVEADRKKIVEVLDNLLDNAIQFTHTGKIELGFVVKREQVEFFVADTGIGVPRDKQAVIFEKLIKLNESTPGLGLGLAICKNTIEHMGGTIGVDSKEGVGSRFWFRLPVKDFIIDTHENKYETNNNVVLNSSNMDQKEMNTQTNIESEKPFVLIAEDNESNYFLAYTILKKDYKIEHALNGVEAVEMVANKNPDLVLMDMKMPIMGGLEATRKIRETGATLPIIALTAHAFDSDMDQALEAGCDDFVTKPIDTAKLKEVIKKHLEK